MSIFILYSIRIFFGLITLLRTVLGDTHKRCTLLYLIFTEILHIFMFNLTVVIYPYLFNFTQILV